MSRFCPQLKTQAISPDRLWWAQLEFVVWFSLRKTDKPRNNFHTFPVTNYNKNVRTFIFHEKKGNSSTYFEIVSVVIQFFLPSIPKSKKRVEFGKESHCIFWNEAVRICSTKNLHYLVFSHHYKRVKKIRAHKDEPT